MIGGLVVDAVRNESEPRPKADFGKARLDYIIPGLSSELLLSSIPIIVRFLLENHLVFVTDILLCILETRLTRFNVDFW